MIAKGMITAQPIRDFVAAVSVGLYEGSPVLDLDYPEDSACDTDMNVVMTGARPFCRGAGHGRGCSRSRATEMDAAARRLPPRA
jgi:ribonuclease PH